MDDILKHISETVLYE